MVNMGVSETTTYTQWPTWVCLRHHPTHTEERVEIVTSKFGRLVGVGW